MAAMGRDVGDVAHGAADRLVGSDPGIEAMARALIDRVGDVPGAVLLDMEVDGARYRLTRSAPATAADLRGDGLSPRELEIARMVALGHANKTIARVLEISSWTVNTHLRRIFAKLSVTSRAAMVARLVDGQGPLAAVGAVVEPELDLRG